MILRVAHFGGEREEESIPPHPGSGGSENCEMEGKAVVDG